MTTDEHRARREPGPRGARSRLGTTRRTGAAFVAAVCTAALFPTVVEGSDDDAALTNTVGELSPTEIIEIVSEDGFVLDDGGIIVEDLAPLGPFLIEEAAEPAAAQGDLPMAAMGVDDAFSLHSKPDATRKIMLDFDGQVVSGTAWNGGDEIVAGPYQRGSDTSPAFNQAELDAIVEVWERVAEDFAPWDVDVTTEDPGADGLSKTSPDDVEFGIRTIITPDYEWYDTRRFGGVAYLWSFTRSSDLPAWVFSSNLAAGNPKSIAEAVSHEVGHSLGLRHDGTASSSYYSGHGQWAPIMGVGYSRTITQWSDGRYPDASNTEDDLTIIDGVLSRTSGGESTLPSSGPSVTEHVMTSSGGTNVHTLAVTEGPVTITIDKVDPSGNLLADLVVRDPLGQVVGTSTPIHPATWSLAVSLPADVPPGTYTVEVRSVGWAGDGSGDAGFPSYGSLGAYTVGIDMPGSGTTTTTIPGTTPTTAPPGSTPTTQPPTDSRANDGDRLSPISPVRVLDTRADSSSGRLRAGQNLRLDLTDAPAGAVATIVNVVAVNPTGSGWLSLTPCNPVELSDRTSSLNFRQGGNIANSVVVPLSDRSEICLYTSTTTHVVADVTGWIGASGSLTLDEIGSHRAVDTREGLGISRRLGAGSTTEIDLTTTLSGDDIGAVALNVTAVRPATRGYLTIDDCSGDPDATSSLNVEAGDVRGNNGVFALGTGQRLCVSTTTATHVTIDVTGEFGTGNGRNFVVATPERVLDTRLREPLDPGASTAFTVPGATLDNGLSVTPSAASVNVTAARPRSGGFVTAWNCGPRPDTSALNPAAGASRANGALVSLSPNGRSCLFHSAGGHLIVDLNGWWI